MNGSKFRVDGAQKGTFRISRIVPEHDTSELMFEDVGALDGQRLRVFIRHENVVFGTVEVWHRGGIVPIALKPILHMATDVTIAGKGVWRRLAGLKQTGIDIGDVGPAVSIERTAQNDFSSGYSGSFVMADRHVRGDMFRIGWIRE